MGGKMIIPGRLAGLNDLVSHKHWAIRNRIKKENKEIVQNYIMAAKLMTIENPCRLYITCYEKNKKRDKDNVTSGARKIIQDALVDSNILPNDTPRWIIENIDKVDYDKENPRIEVEVDDSYYKVGGTDPE